MTALDDLNGLLANLPNYALLTDSMKNTALEGARIPDSFGVWPGEEGYEPTYDPYFAALNLMSFLMAQPVVRQSSSEGTSVAVDAPNWMGLATYYRSQSPICAVTASGPLGVIEIDNSHVHKTYMGGRGDEYGDVDTDLG